MKSPKNRLNFYAGYTFLEAPAKNNIPHFKGL